MASPELAPFAEANRDDSRASVVDRLRRLGRWAPIEPIAAEIRPPGAPADTRSLMQWLMCQGALYSLDELPALHLPSDVEQLLLKCFQAAAGARPELEKLLNPKDEIPFRALCDAIALRRFPGGTFDWNVDGFPPSWLRKVPLPDLPRIGGFLARLGGFKPLIVPHISPLRRRPTFLFEKEVGRSYHRMARFMEPRPEIRGVFQAAWFLGPSTARVTPHLAWLRELPAAGGASFTTLGPSDPRDGFMTGSDERRKLYEAGEYKPETGAFLWARQDFLDWARAHPEFGPEGR